MEQKAAILKMIRDHPELALSRVASLAGVDWRVCKPWVEIFKKKGFITIKERGSYRFGNIAPKGLSVISQFERTRALLGG